MENNDLEEGSRVKYERKGTICRLRKEDRVIWSFFTFEVIVMGGEYITFNFEGLA